MTYVGRPLRRLEDARLLVGDGRYTEDWSLPGQVSAAFVRSPHAHARIVSLEIADAVCAPGVLGVFTAADYAADGCQPIRHAPIPADTIDYTRPAFRGVDEPQPPLAADRVRYVGEALAVVIATSPGLARDAAELVEVEYEVLPSVSDGSMALAASAPDVSPLAPGNLGASAEFGDPARVAEVLAASEVVVEHEFRVQRVANAQMEPRSAIGAYDAETRSYLMIAGSQGVVRQRLMLAAALGVSREQVRVVSPDVGGGFGPRTALYPEQVLVTWAAKRVGRPVRWTSDRTEAFLTDSQGRDSVMSTRLGLQRDGRILALEVDALWNIGAYTGSYVPLSNAARIMTSVYDIGCACVRVRGALSHTVPTGPYRGAGRPEAIYALERLLDLAARRIGMDCAELRRRNLIRRSQLPYLSAMGLTYDSGDFVGNLERVLTLADWNGFAARRGSASSRGRLAGIGVACYVEAPVGAPSERVELRVIPEGAIEVIVGTQSTGQGHATSFAQVVADALGVVPTQVRLVTGDTRRVAVGGGTHSDRSMRLAGTLLVEACARLRDLAREYDPDGRESLFSLAQRHRLTAEAAFTGRIPAHPTGAAVAEVEVDPETGRVALVRYVCVDDVGQVINPLIVDGQVHGGIVQGLGQALSEGVVFDPHSAQMLSASFADYAVPRATDLPWFETELVEDPTPGNPLRIKGGGESGITPCMAAVVNAVADAIGAADLEMPMSPGRVWQVICRAPG